MNGNSSILHEQNQSLFDVMHDSALWHLPICQSHLESIRWPLSELVNNSNGGPSANSTALPPSDAASSFAQMAPSSRQGIRWIQILLPIICSVGISGNILNLIVLTRKRFCAPQGKLERSANLGLTALALSDMMFCAAVLPNVFVGDDDGRDDLAPDSGSRLFVLYYKIYGISCINLFLMTSTWLIVALAVERYIVLYLPLKAKWLLSLKRNKVILALIYASSVLLTLPYFLHLTVARCIGLDGLQRHEIVPRWRGRGVGHLATNIYNLHIWPAVAVFLPLVVLFICNIRLVQGLRNVPTTRRQKCPGQKIRDVNTRITLTLIIIVATALILVTPSEILKVINPYKRWGSWGTVVASIANLLQSLNFAFNFVLYCAIDRNFRQICRNIVLGYCRPKPAVPGETDVIFFYRPKTGSFSLRGVKHSDTTSSRSERLFL